MRIDFPRTALWLTLAALLTACGVIVLRACDLHFLPLFDLRYCSAHGVDEGLSAERARTLELQAKIREAELRIAEKPGCAIPQPKIEPEQDEPPAIKDLEPPAEDSRTPRAEEQLKIPDRIADLKGCWESLRGDIEIVTDDAEQRPIGKVRKCFCFGGNGRGQLKMSYTDGAKCRGPISAELQGETLRIRQPAINCAWKGQNRGHVPSEITCRGSGENEAASCDQQDLGRNRNFIAGEKYRRVDKDHCR